MPNRSRYCRKSSTDENCPLKMCLRQIRSSRIVSNVNICIFFFTSFVTHRIRRVEVYFSIRDRAVFTFQMLRPRPHRKNVRIFYAGRFLYTAAAANYAGQRGINTHIYQYTTNFDFFKEFFKISLKTCVNDKPPACSAGFSYNIIIRLVSYYYQLSLLNLS